jgi:DNA-binding transcriptional ArsR family regulator
MNKSTELYYYQPNASVKATEICNPSKRIVGPPSARQAQAQLPPASITSMRLMPSTARRLANMRLLLAELALREMQVDEIAKLLSASSSAARNYVYELRDAGVVDAVHDRDGRFRACKPSYRLSSNPAKSRDFIEAMVNSERDARVLVRPGTAGKRGQVIVGIARRVHIMGDDVHYSIRVDREPVRRDPLVTALFGAAPASVRGWAPIEI